MNKLFAIIICFTLFSCGEEVPREDQSFKNLGNIVAVDDEILTAGDQELLSKVCNALSSKESYFKSFIVNNTLSYTYTQSESICGATPSPKDVTLSIDSADNGKLSYNSESDTPLFNYVETKSFGSLEKYCERLDGIDEDQGIVGVPRYIEEDNMVNIVNLFTERSSVCSGDNDTVCAFVQFAYKLDDGNYRVDQIVKLSIDTNDNSTPKGIVEVKEVAQVCLTDSSKKETIRKITLKED
jgi:hypothetical protein